MLRCKMYQSVVNTEVTGNQLRTSNPAQSQCVAVYATQIYLVTERQTDPAVYRQIDTVV